MKDEISKRFDKDNEKVFCTKHPDNDKTCVECALNRLNNSLIDSFKDSLNSELERQDKEFDKDMEAYHDNYYALEKRFKKQQKVNNEVLADKCDEMERLLKEQEKRLRLNVAELTSFLETQSQFIIKGDANRLATAICTLKDKEK